MAKKRKTTVSDDTNRLQDAISVMGVQLVAWRQTPEDSSEERQKCLENFFIAAREGFQIKAIVLLRGRKRTDKNGELITSGELDESEAADDFAQECVLKLISSSISDVPKAPFVPKKIDELLDTARTEGKPLTGEGSPISGYLHRLLFRAVAVKVAVAKKKAKKRRIIGGISDDETDARNLASGGFRMGSEFAKVPVSVSVRQNVDIARKIQDEYLDSKTYKGRPLRECFGMWTPLDEWLGICCEKDRPNKKEPPEVEEQTVLKHINKIRRLIKNTKSKVKSFADEPKDKSLLD